jgi:tetratricopeptide (TPR) repeat protein
MTKNLLKTMALAAAFALTAPAQNQLPPQPGQAAPEAQPGQPSPEEIAEFQKVAAAQGPDAQIAAADAFYQKFKTSMLAPFVLEVAAQANQQKGNSARAIFYYNEVLKLDPKNYNAMLMIAAETAQGTREFDIDKEEKLGRATKLVSDAMALIPDAPKPNDQVTDQQWAELKKDDMARGHMALGLVAMARKNYPEAVKEFQTAVESAANPDPVVQIRLGNALNEARRPDEAIAVLDKVIALDGLPPVFKQIAEEEKKRSQQIKAAK